MKRLGTRRLYTYKPAPKKPKNITKGLLAPTEILASNLNAVQLVEDTPALSHTSVSQIVY